MEDKWGDSLASDKLELAVLYFKSKEYEKALKLYNDLVRNYTNTSLSALQEIRTQLYGLARKPVVGPVIHPKLGTVLDQRAAAFEKLGQLERSLKDGIQLTKLEPIGCKGYLRVGKVLLLMSREWEAYKWYHIGVHTIEKAIKEHQIEVPQKLLNNLKEKYKEMKLLVKSIDNPKNPSTGFQTFKQETSSQNQSKATAKERPPSTKISLSQNSAPKDRRSTLENSTAPLLSSCSLKSTSLSAGNTLLSRTRSNLTSATKRPISASRDEFFSSTNFKVIPLKRSKSIGHQPIQRNRNLDPFICFPLELLQCIFESVPLKQILSCHLVCKSWYYQLTKLPKLYTNRVTFKSQITLDEFNGGVQLLKKVLSSTNLKLLNSFRLKSTLNSSHLNRIIGTIINEPSFSLRSLEIFDSNFNIQLLLSRLIKSSWKFNNLKTVETLRIGVNSSIRYENLLFELFKKLKILTIISLSSDMSGKYNELVNKSDIRLKKLIAESKDCEYPTLESLILINHPKLCKDELGFSPGFDTYNPYPILLQKHFPNIRELAFVSFDFNNRLPALGEFLLKSNSLAKITFENNFHFTLFEFLQLVKNYNPNFLLKSLTFREKSNSGSSSLNEFGVNDFPQFTELTDLDINGCSLSCKGFLRLIRIINKDDRLSTLSIGGSKYLKFKTDTFHNRESTRALLSLYDLLVEAPKLKSLSLHDLELDNQSMKHFSKDIKRFGYSNCKLKTLDMSFSKIEGIGLIDLFEAFPSMIAKRQDSFFSVEKLAVDGMEINKSTLSLLTKHGYVGEIQNNPTKQRWQEFGVNTMIIT